MFFAKEPALSEAEGWDSTGLDPLGSDARFDFQLSLIIVHAMPFDDDALSLVVVDVGEATLVVAVLVA